VQYSSFPIVEGETILGAVVTFIDITQRRRSEGRLQRTLSELRTLSRRLDVIREEERTRIARELHDELGVRLTCLKLDLARLQSLMGESLFPREKMEEKVRSMTAEVDSTIVSIQRLVAELRPGILDDLGLVAAIEWQCQDFERRSGTRCFCEAPQEVIRLDRSHATAAFRICQEALTNIARHAEATCVGVLVEQVNGELLLEIQDDGRGIPADKLADSASLGLLGMRERARSLGGQVEIAGSPGQGTTVTLRLPCQNPEARWELGSH
jgi:signal transduction histidine kinase